MHENLSDHDLMPYYQPPLPYVGLLKVLQLPDIRLLLLEKYQA
jgi:hypothetical protein